VKKTIYTLCVNDYEPAIRDLTFPLIRGYADKIDADFHVITERKYPAWPITYEKLQVRDFADQRGDEWSLFVDADTLISPEFFDITAHLPKDTVCHNGKDVNSVRWKMNKYFLRDGRFIGSCNWFTVASEWTRGDLWRPLEVTPEEAVKNIFITIGEYNSGHCQTEHLVDDYTLSHNIARFGLKFTTVTDVCGTLGWKTPDGKGFSPFLFHMYTISAEEKIKRMLAQLTTPNQVAYFQQQDGSFGPRPAAQGQPPAGVGWGLMSAENGAEFRKKWGVK